MYRLLALGRRHGAGRGVRGIYIYIYISLWLPTSSLTTSACPARRPPGKPPRDRCLDLESSKSARIRKICEGR